MMPENLSSILCIGAHADDIEIGCGGTLLAIQQANPAVSIRWAVFSACPIRAAEVRKSAKAFDLPKEALAIYDFRDAHFPDQWSEIKVAVHDLASGHRPDIVFTHARKDRHQDHRVLSELTWNAFRNHLILEYEIPKFDADLGQPNCFRGIDEAIAKRKCEILEEAYPSQKEKYWFNSETMLALMRIRGVEAGKDHLFAEAFHGRKINLKF